MRHFMRLSVSSYGSAAGVTAAVAVDWVGTPYTYCERLAITDTSAAFFAIHACMAGSFMMLL